MIAGLFSLGLAMASMALGIGLVLPLLPVFATDLGASGFMVGLIFGINPIVRGILMPVFGRYSDLSGKKFLMLLGLGGNVLCGLGFALSEAAWHLFVLRMVQGALTAAVMPTAMAYAGNLSSHGREGSVMGLFFLSFMLGLAGGPVVGGAMAEAYGYAVPFYTMALMSGIAFLLVLLLVPEQKAGDTASATKPLSFATILSERVVQGLLVGRGFNAMSIGIYFAILPLVATLTHGMGSTQIGIIVSSQIITMAPLQPVFGRLADMVSRVALGAVGLAVASASLIMIPWARGFNDLLVLSMLLGLSGAIFNPSAVAIAVHLGRGMGMGSLLGLLEMAMALGMGIGSMSSGLLSDLFSLEFALQVGAVAGLLAVAAFYLMTRSYRHLAHQTETDPAVRASGPDRE